MSDQPPPTSPRSSWHLLRDPVFGPFFFGKLISNLGVWTYNIVAALVTYQVTGSALAVGVVSALQLAPQLLSPLSGSAADRHGNRLRQLLVGRLVATVGCAAMAAIAWPNGIDDTLGVVVMGATGVLIGVGFMIGAPAMQSMIPSLVRPTELARAVALDGIPLTVSRAVGPVLGAASLAHLGAPASFGIAAVTQALFMVLLLRLPRERPDRGAGRERLTDHRVRVAVRHLRVDPPVALLLLGVAGVGVATDPAITLAPSLADALGRDQGFVQTLVLAFGAGTGLGYAAVGPIQGRVGSARMAQSGLWLIVTGLGAIALGPGPTVTGAALLIAGLGLSIAFAGLTTLLHQRVPEVLRGRIMALWLLALLGTRPVAALTGGAVTELHSVGGAFTVSAVVVGVVALVATPARLGAPVPTAKPALAAGSGGPT